MFTPLVRQSYKFMRLLPSFMRLLPQRGKPLRGKRYARRGSTYAFAEGAAWFIPMGPAFFVSGSIGVN